MVLPVPGPPAMRTFVSLGIPSLINSSNPGIPIFIRSGSGRAPTRSLGAAILDPFLHLLERRPLLGSDLALCLKCLNIPYHTISCRVLDLYNTRFLAPDLLGVIKEPQNVPYVSWQTAPNNRRAPGVFPRKSHNWGIRK